MICVGGDAFETVNEELFQRADVFMVRREDADGLSFL